MPLFMYRCASKGYRVQGYTAEEVSEANTNGYLTVLCTVCQQVHLVYPTTGEILAEDDELTIDSTVGTKYCRDDPN